ncbi:hypothetical protein [Spiroplasma endosymbiont of Diplazon laetatorius]
MKKLIKNCYKCKKKIKDSENYNSFKTIDVFGNDIYEISCINCFA